MLKLFKESIMLGKMASKVRHAQVQIDNLPEHKTKHEMQTKLNQCIDSINTLITKEKRFFFVGTLLALIVLFLLFISKSLIAKIILSTCLIMHSLILIDAGLFLWYATRKNRQT